jgi:PAS domain S-box-containing protein
MTAPPSLGWLSRLTAAFAGDAALPKALSILAEIGVRVGEAHDQPWLRVKKGESELVLVAERALAPELKDIVENLLLGCFAREYAEKERVKVGERFELLSAASFEGIMIHAEGKIIFANQRLGELVGYTAEEMLGPDMFARCCAPEDQAATLQRVATGFEGAYVITGIRRDGSRFRAELLSKQGQLGTHPVRVAAVRDVTEREHMMALLRESESRLRNLVDTTFDVVLLSRDGIVIEAGGRTEEMFGASLEAVVGRRLLDFTAPSWHERVAQMVAENRVGVYEAEAIGPDGRPYPVQIVGVKSTLEGEPVRISALRDLREVRRREEERHALEKRVAQSQRVESLGVLAGGIAHDFNNLLLGIMGNAELLLEQKREVDERAVRNILAAGRRAADLTAQMLAYAGRRELARREPVDLAVVCRELRELLSAVLSKKAELELELEAGSVVLGERAGIVQVLMNLLTNASDALAGKPGTIRVRARRIHELGVRWERALGAALRPGDWVLIEVQDTGIGMDDAARERVFEPFFTTKETGHGLGLAACLGIVAAHGGAMLVESELGKGSCFSLLLPASDIVPSAPPPVAERQRETPCRVLVIDDEALVRSYLKASLERRGYRVLDAPDGHGGLRALENNEVDVVILDMTMPDLDGGEVLRRVRRSGNRVPIVLSSGHIDPEVQARLEPGSFQGFLAKPFATPALISAIEQALAGARAASER